MEMYNGNERKVMVVGYLEKIRNGFVEEKMKMNAEISDLLIQQKENSAFVQLLENESDESFEAFTPRTINSYNKRKVDEIKVKQKNIEEKMGELKSKLEDVEKELDEIDRVIKVAKRKIR